MAQRIPQPPEAEYFPIFLAPDIDPMWGVNPGLLTDVANLVPSKRGTYKSYSCSNTEDALNLYGASFGPAYYGEIIKRTDGSARLIIGTQKNLLESTATGAVDISKGATAYATVSAWCFATFGNDLLAVSKTNPVQVSTAQLAVFADLGGGPPKASCCTVQKNFVILGDCNDGVNDLGDQVWWSALGNDASWTPSAATQAGNLRILSAPGKITALVKMRDAVAIYKEDSVHILDYQGSPLLWTERMVSNQVGCAALHGVASVNGIHYFLHRTGVHRFDGASVINVGKGVNKYLFDKMGNQANYATAQVAYDEYEGVILWYFGTAGGTTLPYAFSFHPETGRFGFVANTVNPSTGSCNSVLKSTLSDFAAWNSATAFAATSSNLAVLAQGTLSVTFLRKPVLGSSGAQTATATTGDLGDEISVVTVNRVKARMLSFSGSIASMNVATKMSESESYGTPIAYVGDASRRRWDGMASGRFVQMTIPITNYGEIAGVYITKSQSGSE